jgi:hypothetical protein
VTVTTHHPADAVWEIVENRATGDQWAAYWNGGKLVGTVDVTDMDPLPTARELPALGYYRPDPGDETLLKSDLWVIVTRYTNFVSATPPEWIVQRQRVTRRNTYDPPKRGVPKDIIDREGARELTPLDW